MAYFLCMLFHYTLYAFLLLSKPQSPSRAPLPLPFLVISDFLSGVLSWPCLFLGYNTLPVREYSFKVLNHFPYLLLKHIPPYLITSIKYVKRLNSCIFPSFPSSWCAATVVSAQLKTRVLWEPGFSLASQVPINLANLYSYCHYFNSGCHHLFWITVLTPHWSSCFWSCSQIHYVHTAHGLANVHIKLCSFIG